MVCDTNAMQNAMLIKWIKCNTIIQGGGSVAFRIKPDRKETENKTIRFPLELVEKINVTFSGFVIQACEYALNNLEDEKKNI